MKYLKTYKLFENYYEDEGFDKITFPYFSKLKFDIDSNYEDIDISNFEFYDYPNDKCYNIEFEKDNDYHYAEFNKDESSWVCSLSEYIHNKKDIKELYNAILSGCLRSLGSIRIDNMLEQINEREKSNKDINNKIKEFIRLKNDIEKSTIYQKYLLDKGDILKLMNIKKLKPSIESQIMDIKKQSDWS